MYYTIYSFWKEVQNIIPSILMVCGAIGGLLALVDLASRLLRWIHPNADNRSSFKSNNKNKSIRLANVVLLVFVIVIVCLFFVIHEPLSTKYLVLPIDTMEDTCYGTPHNVEYAKGKEGKCILLKRDKQGAVNYPLVSEGTIEFSVKVLSGYTVNNHKTTIDFKRACIYTTVGYDSWYPGSMAIFVYSNGDIHFSTATGFRKNNGEMQELIATKSKFRFNKWHSLGISFGSEGQYLYLDGEILTSQKNYIQPLAVGGDTIKPCDQPTFGYFHSCYDPIDSINSWDIGFEGLIDNVKISHKQLDW